MGSQCPLEWPLPLAFSVTCVMAKSAVILFTPDTDNLLTGADFTKVPLLAKSGT